MLTLYVPGKYLDIAPIISYLVLPESCQNPRCHSWRELLPLSATLFRHCYDILHDKGGAAPFTQPNHDGTDLNFNGIPLGPSFYGHVIIYYKSYWLLMSGRLVLNRHVAVKCNSHWLVRFPSPTSSARHIFSRRWTSNYHGTPGNFECYILHFKFRFFLILSTALLIC